MKILLSACLLWVACIFSFSCSSYILICIHCGVPSHNSYQHFVFIWKLFREKKIALRKVIHFQTKRFSEAKWTSPSRDKVFLFSTYIRVILSSSKMMTKYVVNWLIGLVSNSLTSNDDIFKTGWAKYVFFILESRYYSWLPNQLSNLIKSLQP